MFGELLVEKCLFKSIKSNIAAALDSQSAGSITTFKDCVFSYNEVSFVIKLGYDDIFKTLKLINNLFYKNTGSCVYSNRGIVSDENSIY